MRKEKHVEDLIGLLKDIRKEPSPATIGFIHSTALIHMFHLTFYDEIDPGRAIKHEDFRSKSNIEKMKSLIKDFKEKEKMFELWREMESKRNELCYGYPEKEDIEEYTGRFYKIKDILERISNIKFEVEFLEELLKKVKDNE